MQIAYTGDEALLTIGTGPDHGMIDISINGRYWRRFNTYATTPAERVIHLPQVPTLPGETSGTLEIRNHSDRHRRSTGYVFRFKQLAVIDATYNERTIDYTYDGLSRLQQANYNTGQRIYDYNFDLAGNRTQEALSGTGVTAKTTDYTYNAANQLTNDGTNVLAYDPNGNLISDGTNTYTWDRANRLAKVDNGTPADLTAYAYDGVNNRISQSIGTTTPTVTQYLLDTQPGLTKVLAATTGTNTNHYIHAPQGSNVPGIHAMQSNTGDWTYTLPDALGSVRGQIDMTLGVSQIVDYDPYGNPNTPIEGFAFTGELRDANGLQYHRARYYHPSLGVFNSRDPFEGITQRPMSLNGYSWVEGNPVMNTDPSGKISISGSKLAHTLNSSMCSAGMQQTDCSCHGFFRGLCPSDLFPPCKTENTPTPEPLSPEEYPVVVFMGGSFADNNTEFQNKNCQIATIHDDGPDPFRQTPVWLDRLVTSRETFTGQGSEAVGCSNGVVQNGYMVWHSTNVKSDVRAHGVVVVRYNGSKELHAVAAFVSVVQIFPDTFAVDKKRPVVAIGYSSGADSVLFFGHMMRDTLDVKSVTSLGPTFTGGFGELPAGRVEGNSTLLLSDILDTGVAINVIDDSGNSYGDVETVKDRPGFRYYDLKTVQGLGVNEHYDRDNQGDGTNNSIDLINRIYEDLGLIQ